MSHNLWYRKMVAEECANRERKSPIEKCACVGGRRRMPSHYRRLPATVLCFLLLLLALYKTALKHFARQQNERRRTEGEERGRCSSGNNNNSEKQNSEVNYSPSTKISANIHTRTHPNSFASRLSLGSSFAAEGFVLRHSSISIPLPTSVNHHLTRIIIITVCHLTLTHKALRAANFHGN